MATRSDCTTRLLLALEPRHSKGSTIRCLKGGRICALLMSDHPLNGSTFGVPGTLTKLVDLWVEERRLPSYMRAVPKPGG